MQNSGAKRLKQLFPEFAYVQMETVQTETVQTETSVTTDGLRIRNSDIDRTFIVKNLI
jgi:hypothetical protein